MSDVMRIVGVIALIVALCLVAYKFIAAKKERDEQEIDDDE